MYLIFVLNVHRTKYHTVFIENYNDNFDSIFGKSSNDKLVINCRKLYQYNLLLLFCAVAILEYINNKHCTHKCKFNFQF